MRDKAKIIYNQDLLTTAIIVQAVIDYLNAKKVINRKKNGGAVLKTELKEAQEMLTDCEQFFVSGLFDYMTDFEGKVFLTLLESAQTDGDVLLKNLEKIADEKGVEKLSLTPLNRIRIPV